MPCGINMRLRIGITVRMACAKRHHYAVLGNAQFCANWHHYASLSKPLLRPGLAYQK